MIPLLMTIRVQWFRLWIPLLLVWLLFLPVILLLLPLTLMACLIIGIPVLRALRLLWQIFTGISGTRFDSADGKHTVAIRIY